MHEASALPFIVVGSVYVVIIAALVAAYARRAKRISADLDRRRVEAETRRARLRGNLGGPRLRRATAGYNTPTYPGSPLYGGHAAPATCHSHGDAGFSCASDSGSDGGGGGD